MTQHQKAGSGKLDFSATAKPEAAAAATAESEPFDSNPPPPPEPPKPPETAKDLLKSVEDHCIATFDNIVAKFAIVGMAGHELQTAMMKAKDEAVALFNALKAKI